MKKTLLTEKQNNTSLALTGKSNVSPKLTKLNYLLENSQSFQAKLARVNVPSSVSCFSFEEKCGDLSTDLPLFLSLTEKPVDLLFSIDQFVFEFSKTTYQQRKTGEFFQQLKERKKLSLFYGHLTRKQITSLFKKAGKMKGYFSRNFFSLLERRLDITLYRSGFTQTIAEARQLIKHNKVRVNETRVNVSSYLLNSGDIISLHSEKQSTLIHQTLNAMITPKSKQHSKVFEEYYSRLKKLLDGSSLHSFLQKKDGKKFYSKKNLKQKQDSFYTKSLCKLLIQCVLNRIKSRSFFSLFSKSNQQESSPFLIQSQSLEKNKFLTLLKWKSSLGFKSSQKKTVQQRQFTKKLKDSPKISYATGGCLEKKPVFWNQTVLDGNKRKFFLQKKHVSKEFHLLKNKNRLLIKTCFLLFLKQLSIHEKFQNLVVLNFKKSFYKKSVDQAQFRFSRILHWRTSKPIHIETSYSILTSIFLYAPQRINFPFFIDLDLIQRSLR